MVAGSAGLARVAQDGRQPELLRFARKVEKQVYDDLYIFHREGRLRPIFEAMLRHRVDAWPSHADAVDGKLDPPRIAAVFQQRLAAEKAAHVF